MPRRPPRRRGQTGVGPCAGAGRAARLPQRPGLGDRPHRHDRPGDGLRHHRHRTRFLAGQVQEAGRRRPLQDHQPDRHAGAQDAGLRRGGDRPHRGLRGGPRLARHGAGDQSRDPGGARLRRGDDRDGSRSRSPPPSTSASPSRATPWATPSAATSSASTRPRSPIPSSTCWRASASRRATSRRRTCTPAGRCRSRARPISRPNISRCSIVRIPVDEMARAACLRRVIYA